MGLVGLFVEVTRDRPAPDVGKALGEVGERPDEVLAAHLRGHVVGVGDADERDLARERELTSLGRDHAAGVIVVFFQGVEPNAADGVLHVNLILYVKRNLLGRGDNQQVIGDLVGVGRAGAGAEAREVLLLALAGAIAERAAVFFVVMFFDLGRLRFS